MGEGETNASVKLIQEPILRNPSLVAVWPGIGNIAARIGEYLVEKLGAEELGEIEPFDFFSPVAVLVEDNIIEVPEANKWPGEENLPRSRFYYWRRPGPGDDLLFFLGEAQPYGKETGLAHLVLDVAQRFGVRRVYACAAAIASTSHTERPRVWAAATDKSLVEYLKQFDVVLRDKVQIRGLNGLILGVAKERKMEGICLLGEIPAYIVQMGIEYPRSAQAVLEVLSSMLEIEVDMAELQELVREVDEGIEESVKEAMDQMGQLMLRPEEAGSAETGQLPESARQHIEHLFTEAEQDKSRASELKAELDRWGVFHEYEDRFLDIFRTGGGEQD